MTIRKTPTKIAPRKGTRTAKAAAVTARKPAAAAAAAQAPAPKPAPTARAVAAADAAAPPTPTKEPRGKMAIILALLRRPDGATIFELCQATGWQGHSVRGALAGQVKGKLGLVVTSEKPADERIYRIVDADPPKPARGRRLAK